MLTWKVGGARGVMLANGLPCLDNTNSHKKERDEGEPNILGFHTPLLTPVMVFELLVFIVICSALTPLKRITTRLYGGGKQGQL